MDGRWTSCGRAGAAEIAWEEARDGGARSKVSLASLLQISDGQHHLVACAML